MLKDLPVDEITQVIGLATTPAFLLGAVAGLLSLLVIREPEKCRSSPP